jgi:hypothetical protein
MRTNRARTINGGEQRDGSGTCESECEQFLLRDVKGRYFLNDFLHKAAGGQERHSPDEHAPMGIKVSWPS